MHFLKTYALHEVVLFFGRDRWPSPICMVPCCRVYTTTRTIFGCPPPSWLKWACRPWSARHRPAQRTSASKEMRSRRSGRNRCPSLISYSQNVAGKGKVLLNQIQVRLIALSSDHTVLVNSKCDDDDVQRPWQDRSSHWQGCAGVSPPAL